MICLLKLHKAVACLGLAWLVLASIIQAVWATLPWARVLRWISYRVPTWRRRRRRRSRRSRLFIIVYPTPYLHYIIFSLSNYPALFRPPVNPKTSFVHFPPPTPPLILCLVCIGFHFVVTPTWNAASSILCERSA